MYILCVAILIQAFRFTIRVPETLVVSSCSMTSGFSVVDLTGDDDAVTLVTGSLSQESVKSATAAAAVPEATELTAAQPAMEVGVSICVPCAVDVSDSLKASQVGQRAKSA